MKKSAIREGATYKTKNGSAARRVIAIVQDSANLPGPAYWYETQDGPWVRYMQERGPNKGSESVLQLSSFASWACSEDSGAAPDGIAALREKVATLLPALEKTLSAYIGSSQDVMRLDGEKDEAKLRTIMDDDCIVLMARAAIAKATA